MKGLLLLLFLGVSLTSQAQWVIIADTATCRIEIYTSDTSELETAFLIDECRYVDRGDKISIFDDKMSFTQRANVIDNYADITAIKTAIDAWIKSCR